MKYAVYLLASLLIIVLLRPVFVGVVERPDYIVMIPIAVVVGMAACLVYYKGARNLENGDKTKAVGRLCEMLGEQFLGFVLTGVIILFASNYLTQQSSLWADRRANRISFTEHAANQSSDSSDFSGSYDSRFKQLDFTDQNLNGVVLAWIDLSGAILDGASVQNAILTEFKMAGVSAHGSNWSDSEFHDVSVNSGASSSGNLGGKFDADFQSATLDRVKFVGGTLVNMRLKDASLISVKFYRSPKRTDEPLRVDGSDFNRANLKDSSFVGVAGAGLTFNVAVLQNAKLIGSNLTGSRFVGADLSDARFEHTNIGKVDFSGARLDGTVWSNVCWDEGSEPVGLSEEKMGEIQRNDDDPHPDSDGFCAGAQDASNAWIQENS